MRKWIILVILIIISATLFYWFMWRPQDSDFKSASNNVQTIINDMHTIKTNLALVYPFFMKPSVSTDLKSAADSYLNANSILSTSPAVQRDAAVAQTYKKYENEIISYGQTASDISKSIQLFTAMSDSCKDLLTVTLKPGVSTTSDPNYDNCKVALTNAKKSPDKSFNEGFLNKFISAMEKVLDAHQQLVKVQSGSKQDKATVTSQMNTALQEVVNMVYAKVTYDIPVSPLNDLQNVQKSLNSEKAALFR